VWKAHAKMWNKVPVPEKGERKVVPEDDTRSRNPVCKKNEKNWLLGREQLKRWQAPFCGKSQGKTRRRARGGKRREAGERRRGFTAEFQKNTEKNEIGLLKTASSMTGKEQGPGERQRGSKWSVGGGKFLLRTDGGYGPIVGERKLNPAVASARGGGNRLQRRSRLGIRPSRGRIKGKGKG